MAFIDITDAVGPIVLPIRGKKYTLPAISLADGIRMHAAAAAEASLSMTDLMTIMLGDVQAEMIADGVPLAWVDRAMWVGITDFQSGREAAEAVWAEGVPKEVLDALVRKIQEAVATLPAEGSTTPPPASTSGTTGQKKAPARRSAGRTSSTKVAGHSS